MRHAGDEILMGTSCAIPVPLHPWRRFRRGFNQARDLAATLGVPVLPVLRRTRATPPQTGLSLAGRRRNVRGAFEISPRVERYHRSLLVNRAVVLVDDVRTTGATLDACARVLKQAGVAEVRALVAALAEPPGGGETGSQAYRIRRTASNTSAATAGRSRSASTDTQRSDVACRT
jgi:adenine/guanine phosphoribosyltransferase-like PRPP-binding protein